MVNYEYQPKTYKQLKSWYDTKKRNGNIDFENFEIFLSWYNRQAKKCHYCGLTEEVSQNIVKNGILKSKRFPKNGILMRGRSRGVWLEIDRKHPNDNYSEKNCVLSCYFCNNDKSDVFNEEEYKMFVKDRYRYLNKLNKEA